MQINIQFFELVQYTV